VERYLTPSDIDEVFSMSRSELRKGKLRLLTVVRLRSY